MAYLEWKKELDTGIAIIDEQHRLIVDYINRLEDANRSGDSGEIRQVFEDLVDYTATHFSFEENLQERAGYELRAGHQRVHRVFVKRLGEYQARFDAGDPLVGREVLEMLRGWLVNHIRNDDQDYVPAVSRIIEVETRSGWLSRTVKRFFN